MNRTPRPPLPRWLRLLALPLLTAAVLSQSFIDLELGHQLGGWNINLPLADLCACLLLGLCLIPLWRDTRERRAPPLPGFRGYLLFLFASVLSISVAIDPAESLHHVLRKPLFFYLAYGIGLSWWVVRGVGRDSLAVMLLGWAGLCSVISLMDSVHRIDAGAMLWHQPIEGLVPNHKTLAVALAGALPLLQGLELRHRLVRLARQLIWMMAGFAIVSSASKTAILVLLLGLGMHWPRQNPLSFRPRLLVGVLGLGTVLAYYGPILYGSNAMLDAARSRHSLNERALEMFAQNPLVGSGSGMGVHYEMVTWPHYRVNGVDTHGVIQKVASETGLIGLAGYGLFAGSTGWILVRRRREQDDLSTRAALGTWITLHASLLLSTETLSPTHWLPFAMAWGMAHRIPPDRDANSDGPYLPPRAGWRFDL